MYIKWLIFSCYLLSLYSAVHILRMWLSGIMPIKNSKCDRASPWNTPLWIFNSAKLCLRAINCTLQVCMFFPINYMILSVILYILRQFSIHIWGSI